MTTMKDYSLQSTVDEKKRNLTFGFVITALVAVILSVSVMTVVAFHLLRTLGLQTQMNIVAAELNQALFKEAKSVLSEAELDLIDARWPDLKQRLQLTDVALMDRSKKNIWSSTPRLFLSLDERSTFDELITSGSVEPEIVDAFPWGLDRLLLGGGNQTATALIPILNGGETVAYAKSVGRIDAVINTARNTAFGLFGLLLLGHVLLVFVLYYNFRRGIETIENQEKKLNQQISRLSNLLSINKSMQKSMKTASSRAVELNEQFLRRVGSDLHDGPAQSIGYAVLRLDQMRRKPESQSFGHEFHVIKEALDSSLTEIRGISSGLVLPELEQMTLEESLRKVVKRHQSNADTEVAQYYQDLPEHIEVPIKICSYRFVQEGLNNAHRHGKAEKCRISAHVKDDVLHLSLKDNGMGFRKSQLSTEGGHLGLMGLKDRIESLGGRFSINSELGVGTAIKVEIDLSDET